MCNSILYSYSLIFQKILYLLFCFHDSDVYGRLVGLFNMKKRAKQQKSFEIKINSFSNICRIVPPICKVITERKEKLNPVDFIVIKSQENFGLTAYQVFCILVESNNALCVSLMICAKCQTWWRDETDSSNKNVDIFNSRQTINIITCSCLYFQTRFQDFVLKLDSNLMTFSQKYYI